MEDRKITLLKACKKLLQKQSESMCVLNLLETLVYYDGTYCDGLCLLNDIEDLLAELGMSMKDVSVKIFPNCGNSYRVIVTIDDMFDAEEQIDIWIEENLKDVASWEWV